MDHAPYPPRIETLRQDENVDHPPYPPETRRMARAILANSVIYSGVLSAHSAWRADVVPGRPSPTPDSAQGRPCPSRRRRIPWATLLKRVFGIDPTRCDCGGRYRLVATIRDPQTAATILRWLAMRAEPERITPARPPPDPDLGHGHDEPAEAEAGQGEFDWAA